MNRSDPISRAGQISPPPSQPSARRMGLALMLNLSLLLVFLGPLSGCQETKRFPSGAITVTVKPGDTGSCAISPCRVLFEMPPGDDDYRVRGNQVDFGLYPAGQTVNLGDFYEPIAIEVVGAEVPKTYVYIPIDW